MNPKKLDVTTASFKGSKAVNEDYALVDRENGIFLMADGMSGCNGSFASKDVVEYAAREIRYLITHLPEKASGFAFQNYLKEIFFLANAKLIARAETERTEVPGTTLDLVVLREDDNFYYAHIGDGSIYSVRTGNNFRDLFEDQRKEERQELEKKCFTEDQAKQLLIKRGPSVYLGNPKFKKDDVLVGTIQVPERLIMISDGLTNICTNQEIKHLIMNYSGNRMIKAASELYQNPNQMAQEYIRGDSDMLIRLVKTQSDPMFIEIQYKLNKANSLEEQLGMINHTLSHFPKMEQIIMAEGIKGLNRESLGWNDDFSIVEIEK